jgi:hypothetical protein
MYKQNFEKKEYISQESGEKYMKYNLYRDAHIFFREGYSK